MRIVCWIITVLLMITAIACAFDALTTTHSVWVSIPMLLFSGALLGPAFFMLLALLGLTIWPPRSMAIGLSFGAGHANNGAQAPVTCSHAKQSRKAPGYFRC